MDRKKFLKGIGALGVAIPIAGIAGNKLISDPMDEPSNNDLLLSCVESPSETAGPYPTPDSVSQSALVRTDITESTQEGIPLSLTITINNSDDSNCSPVGVGFRVDIWHCNKRGYYSAYSGQPGIDGTQDTTGETWLRGIQYTDANGQVSFTSIYPGWYTPRATHIHVQVYDASNNLLLTTQLAFPEAINSTVNSFYNTSGTNSVTNSTDMVFSDSYTEQLMTVSGDTTNGYTATSEVNVAAGELGLDSFENSGQFSAVVSPNPSFENSELIINLIQPSEVTVDIVDINGRVLKEIGKNALGNGQSKIDLDIISLPSGVYFCKIKVQNVTGQYIETKKIIKK